MFRSRLKIVYNSAAMTAGLKHMSDLQKTKGFDQLILLIFEKMYQLEISFWFLINPTRKTPYNPPKGDNSSPLGRLGGVNKIYL